jgi:hypothetical protein
MSVHDWTLVDAGIFHHFHHEWISEINRALNRTLQGTEYYALAEQIAGGLGPDVLTLQRPLSLPSAPARRERRVKGRALRQGKRSEARSSDGVALVDTPPQLRFHIKDAKKWYAVKKKAVTIRHVSEHRVVAVLEILSPGNKSDRAALADFVRKARDFLAAGIHLGLIDLFPPTSRDPEGIHPLVWGEDDGIFRFDPAQPLTCTSYVGGREAEAFVQPFAVGDQLPTLPLFLTTTQYVPTHLERTYQAAFDAVPEVWREALNR